MRLPRKLPLLPGLRWTGHMTVTRQENDGRWLIDWDATDAQQDYERWIGDRAVLTTAQVKEWTGVDLETS